MPTSLARGCTRPCPRTATRACRRCFASSTPWEYVSVSNLAANARAPRTAPARERLPAAIPRLPNERQVDAGAPWTECWRSPGHSSRGPGAGGRASPRRSNAAIRRGRLQTAEDGSGNSAQHTSPWEITIRCRSEHPPASRRRRRRRPAGESPAPNPLAPARPSTHHHHSFPPSSPHTRFMASVTSSCAWRARYSSSAAVYTSLRDRRPCAASRSARAKMSSGMDTAVFIPAV